MSKLLDAIALPPGVTGKTPLSLAARRMGILTDPGHAQSCHRCGDTLSDVHIVDGCYTWVLALIDKTSAFECAACARKAGCDMTDYRTEDERFRDQIEWLVKEERLERERKARSEVGNPTRSNPPPSDGASSTLEIFSEPELL